MGVLKVNEQLFPGKTVLIKGESLRILNERSRRVGDLISIRDKRGRDFRGRIVSFAQDHSETFIFESLELPVEPVIEIHLIQALPKKERLEWIIQKTTELGVSSILPCESDHSITLEQRNSAQKKSHRWQAIATRAALQCRRARVPFIYPTLPFCDALEIGYGSDLCLLLWEKEFSTSMKRVLAALKGTVRNLTLAVGPEGGFSGQEVERAHERGFMSVGLGPRILRTETAAIAALTILQYELGDLGGKTDRRKA
ncbi:MAG: RsmE family RNA methyltransferase [Proteobacteria bacterium]|nr:RsmE family RNA methyltransferase [Pseudomonadota bacterium]